MSEDQAGIYFDEGSNAPAVYLGLTDRLRDLLRAYLLEQQRTLGRWGDPDKQEAGQQKKVLARRKHTWSPGYTVHWRLVLDPRESIGSVVRLSAYRIEVLHIETPK